MEVNLDVDDDISRPEFSVYQFGPGDFYERVREGVHAEEAVRAAHFYSHNVAAQKGWTKRVIITDGGDYTVFEWKFGEGVTFPPEAKGRQ